MSEISWYLDSSDEKAVVTRLLECGAQLVPDLQYPTPQYGICATFEEYLSLRPQTRMYFVIHSSFLKMPLGIEPNSNGERRWFFIMPRHGGPAISLLLAGEFQKDGNEFIRPGLAGYYRTYIDPSTARNYKAPAKQIAFYRSMVEFVKQRSIIIKTKHRLYFLGTGAVERLRKGSN